MKTFLQIICGIPFPFVGAFYFGDTGFIFELIPFILYIPLTLLGNMSEKKQQEIVERFGEKCDRLGSILNGWTNGNGRDGTKLKSVII